MNIVITGSTQGFGFSLAKEFLKFEDNVIISSRNEDKINETIKNLKMQFPKSNVYGIKCDVSNYEEITILADYSVEKLGKIDIWINNAGTSGFIYDELINISENTIQEVINTNIIGTLFGSKKAIEIMKNQKQGKIFNIAGMGSNGMASPNLTPYGASKSTIPQLTRSLAKETKEYGIGIYQIVPGIMITDLIIKNSTPEASKIFNILGEKPEKVARKLVPKIRKIKGTNKRVIYSSFGKILWKFSTAWARRNKFFDDEGNFIE